MTFGRIFAFLVDMSKDIVFWIFLYSRIGFLLAATDINGKFVVLLVWLDLFIIFYAHVLLGVYVQTRATKIFELPEGLHTRRFMYFFFVVLTPFVPCILLSKVSSISIHKVKLIESGRNSSISPSAVARAVQAMDKNKKCSLETYTRMRLLEGTLESFPQLVLLLAFFYVSVQDPEILSVSDDVNSLDGKVFFVINILYSTLTLLFSLVNAVDAAKGDQLLFHQKVCLVACYFFQLLTRVIPIYIVLSSTINKQLDLTTGALLLFLPIIFHLPAQYLVCHLAAPTFRHLETFDQILHIFANTFFVFPLRSDMSGKQQHKSREIFWSFLLMSIEVLVTMVILLAFSQGDLPESWHLLSCLACLCAGCCSQVLYYNYCHTWCEVTRARWWGPWAAWCGTTYTTHMVQEETDMEEDMDVMQEGQINKAVEQTE